MVLCGGCSKHARCVVQVHEQEALSFCKNLAFTGGPHDWPRQKHLLSVHLQQAQALVQHHHSESIQVQKAWGILEAARSLIDMMTPDADKEKAVCSEASTQACSPCACLYCLRDERSKLGSLEIAADDTEKAMHPR